jgi:hypothetical protein
MVHLMQKGSEMLVHNGTLLAARLLQQEAIAAAASGRNNRKRKRIQKGGTLPQDEANDTKARREALALAKAEA